MKGFTCFFFLLLFLSTESAAQKHSAAYDSVYRDSIIMQRFAELNKLRPLFQQKKAGEDSAFVAIHANAYAVRSGGSNFVPPSAQKNYSSGYYPGNAESEFVNAKPGDVIGPFISGNIIGLYKVRSKSYGGDSVMVRHLLITYRDADRAPPEIRRSRREAKELADSLCKVIVSGKTAMTDLILPFTDDPGSRGGNLGNYGMFGRETPFVKEFKDAGFDNPVGATVVVETAFGFHIIQVLEKKSKQLMVTALPLELIIDHELNYTAQQAAATLPVFPGGITALVKYLNDSLHYPPGAKAKHVEGSIEVIFRIGNNGKVYNVSDVKYGVLQDPEFVAEAIRLVAAMPQWKPAMYKGKEIDWMMSVRVPFLLNIN